MRFLRVFKFGIHIKSITSRFRIWSSFQVNIMIIRGKTYFCKLGWHNNVFLISRLESSFTHTYCFFLKHLLTAVEENNIIPNTSSPSKQNESVHIHRIREQIRVHSHKMQNQVIRFHRKLSTVQNLPTYFSYAYLLNMLNETLGTCWKRRTKLCLLAVYAERN
jgi:hypothetical protein